MGRHGKHAGGSRRETCRDQCPKEKGRCTRWFFKDVRKMSGFEGSGGKGFHGKPRRGVLTPNPARKQARPGADGEAEKGHNSIDLAILSCLTFSEDNDGAAQPSRSAD